nr:hypothetical protein [Citreicella sp. C3M06]
MRITLAALLLSGLAACSSKTGIEYGGVTFDGKVKASKADRSQFVSTGGPVSASIDGASSAARYQGTVYCMSYLGTSDIDWQIGPDTPQGQLPIDDNRVVFQGRCVE